MLNIKKIIFFLVVIGCSMFLGAVTYFFHVPCIDLSVLSNSDLAIPSVVLDDEGKELMKFSFDKREPVIITEIPVHVINAFLAAEDHQFFHHKGISVSGIIRSLAMNIYYGKFVQGASTITQQLVKLLFLDSRKSLIRKIKEQWCSLLVERSFSKEYILQTYLNHIYFGMGIYGVEAASQRFWGKSVQHITCAEAALLAAIVQSPSRYCPLFYPLSALKRRNYVLYRMSQLNFISPAEYQSYKEASLNLIQQSQELIAPHFKEALRQFLEELLGRNNLYKGGYSIQSTLNCGIQVMAEQQFQRRITQLKKSINSEIDGALLCVEVQTGEIKALIGGYNFVESQFDRALHAKRQLGSIIKPLIYIAALERGMNFRQTMIDEPLHIMQPSGLWEPKNYSGNFEGEITLAHALSHSNNMVAIKTLMNVGTQAVIELAKKFKFSCALPPYLSLSLGCLDVTLKEAVGMFNIFANNGMYTEPHMIRWIKDRHGTKVWKIKTGKERIVSTVINSQIAKVLGLGIERMKKRVQGGWLDAQAIGKTGTTNDCRTCRYIGSTPSYTLGIYIGCDDNRSMGKDVYASLTAFPLWFSIMKHIDHQKKEFVYDHSLKEITINSRTGKACNDGDPDAISILIP